MKRTLMIGSALALLMAATPVTVMAEGTTTDPAAANATTQAQMATEVDAGKLIGQDVVDANDETIGEIDGVMVDAGGKVQAVVIDVSSWLESEKLISVPWTDLQISGDNRVTASLTKESATAAATYAYVDPAQKGTVFTDMDTNTAEIEADPATPAPATPDGTVADADAGTEPAITLGSPVKNGDGTINTSQLIGLAVEGSNGENVGEIGEVILDDSGQVEGIVVDVGGFLGVGERPVLVEWKDVTLAGSGDDVRANVSATAESLKSMPVYERAAR